MELIDYNGVPHLLRPVVVETDKVVPVLKWVVKEMEDRYKKFEIAGVRNIDSYNNLKRLAAQPREAPLHRGGDRRVGGT